MLTSAALFFLLVGVARGNEGEQIEFNRDVRPILSQNCFYCHGNDEAHREADLRLDTFEGATQSGAVIPNESSASELIRRIRSHDPDEVMPPPDSEKKLTDEEIETLETWIEQGATFQEHWAWSELSPGIAPKDLKPFQKIDFLLEENWKRREVAPVEKAKPRVLLRRLSFDLRGIPPTAEEVDWFAADPSDQNYSKIRDRWMTELSFAEHQAVGWLDLVRWADTSGFVSDEPIASGAFRKWVIQSMVANMPFDEFSIAQLAGDLLEDPSDEELIASGYNRIVNTNCEAGAIEAEQLYKLKGEHVRAFGTVWLGLTTGCAECHDHKFDPLTAKDYYSLAAFWDDLVEAGVYTPGDRREPLHYVHPTTSARQRDAELATELVELRGKLAAKPIDGLAAWQSNLRKRLKEKDGTREFSWIPSALPAMRVLEGDFSWIKSPPRSNSKPASKTDQRLRKTSAPPNGIARHHAAELITGTINEGSLTKDSSTWFVDIWLDENSAPDQLGIQISHGDYGRLGWKKENYSTYYWGVKDASPLTKKLPESHPDRIKHMGSLPSKSGWIRLEIPFHQLIPAARGQNFEAVGMAWFHHGGTVLWGTSGLQLSTRDCYKLELAEFAMRKWWEIPFNRQVYQHREKLAVEVINKKPEELDATEQELLAEIYRQLSYKDLLTELRKLESDLWLLRARAMPVLVSKSQSRRKTTQLLNRGNYQDTSGPTMSPAVPEFLGKLPGEPNRLALAKWLFSDASALTSRVYVNRLWQQFYGVGLSKTLGDVGTQGDWPSNIKLLDWLAKEFQDSGWDRAHMIRLLTSTQAYKLSSKTPETLAERDPENRLHARQSRFRLAAESIRDSALISAGLLAHTNTVPVQSFFPYQPEIYWNSSDKIMYGSRHMHWDTSVRTQQHYRSLYTFWKRQNIHPTMLAFDAPTRQECTAKRNITNTPGQALALLNDPIFVEAARGLAIRIGGPDTEPRTKDDAANIQLAFRLALQREPSVEETHVLVALLNHSRSSFADNPSDAALLNSVGQVLENEHLLDPIELASWTTVTRAILNLHEFLVRP